MVRIWAPEGLAADGSRAAVLLCGAPVTALAWDARADKVSPFRGFTVLGFKGTRGRQLCGAPVSWRGMPAQTRSGARAAWSLLLVYTSSYKRFP